MSDTPPEFDLKFLPDWLKEGATTSTAKYANYEGEREDRRGGRDDRGPRPGGGRGGFGGGGRPGGGDRRGPRPGGPGGPGGDRRGGGGPRPGGGPGGDRRGPGGPGGDRRGPRPGGPGQRGGPGGPRREESREPREPRQPATPPPQVKIEFLPEPGAAAGIAAQVKRSARAYPLFGAGRLFLERPERHRVRISSVDPTVVLYQVGDGPISFDQTSLERGAFQTLKDEYYKEETVQSEPIKGNFANVARSRSTGLYLGPTNYHSYQPGLRRLYEERFSRRMSFQDFTYQDIEIRTDELSVNEWKEQARSSTTYTTLKEPEPVTFKTLAEAEQHFRAHYARGVIKAGLSLECSGQASRQIAERHLQFALRDQWERERGFPVQLVNNLRPYLMREQLHFFKHRKRILYVSAIRPARHVAGQVFSSNFAGILQAIEEHPKCSRRILATKVLGAQAETPDSNDAKEALARDLLYLIHAGHVIEFADGTFDLPLVPAPAKQAEGKKGGKGGAAAAPAAGTAAETEEPDLSVEALAQAASDEGLSPDRPDTSEPTAPEAAPVRSGNEIVVGITDAGQPVIVPDSTEYAAPVSDDEASPASGFAGQPAGDSGFTAAESLASAAPVETEAARGEFAVSTESPAVAPSAAIITGDATPEAATLPDFAGLPAEAPTASAGLESVGELASQQESAVAPVGATAGELHASSSESAVETLPAATSLQHEPTRSE